MWFDKKHLKKEKPITINNLHGYILPHAGTTYTGHIMSHTLRFKPKKEFTNIVIIYYPVHNTPNVNNKYYHEHFVPFKTLQFYFKKKKYFPLNLKNQGKESFNKKLEKIKALKLKDTIYVISADFSHFLPLQKAIKTENCSAKALMFRNFSKSLECLKVVDHQISFELLYSILPKEFHLQWIGRTRSSSEKGVGYLSFLIRKERKKYKQPNGFFVTAYDEKMNGRECLGNMKEWSISLETNLVNDVIQKAKTTSRLTGGTKLNIPVRYYTITYLYKDKSKEFIRGWHGIHKNAFYLSDVFLEHVFNNGKWIKDSDTEWPTGNEFNLEDTFVKLGIKSGRYSLKKTNHKKKSKKKLYDLYYSEVLHKKII